MSREAGGTAVLLVGLLLVRLTLAEVYQRYVRMEMGPWLLIAGVLLIGLGAVAVAATLRRGSPVAPAAPLETEHHERWERDLRATIDHLRRLLDERPGA